METVVRLSRRECEEELKTLSKYFTCVRLLDHDSLPIGGVAENSENGKCYEIWQKNQRCDYCISARALAEKSSRTKLERVDNAIFQITAKYVEIDGKPCVIEMVREFDDDFLAELGDEGRAMAELGDYYEKIYQIGRAHV